MFEKFFLKWHFPVTSRYFQWHSGEHVASGKRELTLAQAAHIVDVALAVKGFPQKHFNLSKSRSVGWPKLKF